MLIEEELSQFAVDTYKAQVDTDTAHILKRNVLDSYAGICGSLYDTDMLRKFDRMIDIAPVTGGVDVWGTGKSGSHADAVFLNAILGRRSDLLNTYFSPNKMGVAHPSDNLSLILSLADWLGKSGRDVLGLTHLAYMLAGLFSDYYFPESVEYDHDAAAHFLYDAHHRLRARSRSRGTHQRPAHRRRPGARHQPIGPRPGDGLEALHLRVLCPARTVCRQNGKGRH